MTEGMSLQNDYTQWLTRGHQRAAVAQVLRKPMTASEIRDAARVMSPRIRLRDIWFLMRQFAERGLVVCLHPKQVTGSLYHLTAEGRAAVLWAFGIAFEAPKEGIDWRKYSWTVRAKTRRLTLQGLHRLEKRTRLPQTATQIRKQIRDEGLVSLNQVIRALKEMLGVGLIRCAGVTKKQSRKLYLLTPAGKRILQQLQR